MGKSFDEVKKIQEEYIKQYFIYPPVNSCGISSIDIQIGLTKKKIDLTVGESLDDWCISVGFETEPPKEMAFPSEYQGVRVFYQINDTMRAF